MGTQLAYWAIEFNFRYTIIIHQGFDQLSIPGTAKPWQQCAQVIIRFQAFEAEIEFDEQMTKVQPGNLMQSALLDTVRMKPAQRSTNRGYLMSIRRCIFDTTTAMADNVTLPAVSGDSLFTDLRYFTAYSWSASGGNDNYVQRDAFDSLLTAIMPCK